MKVIKKVCERNHKIKIWGTIKREKGYKQRRWYNRYKNFKKCLYNDL